MPERAEAELAKARKVIEVQGNVSALLGRAARAQGARQKGAPSDDRADRQELTPIVGTRPACRALGVVAGDDLPPPASTRAAAHAAAAGPARALSEPEREAVLGRAALGAVRRLRARRRCGRRCWTRAATWPRSARCTGCSPPGTAGCVSGATSSTHPAYARPELLAERPNELWSWDISKLKGPAKWTYFYLYVILDVFSRYAVGWTVQHRENAAARQGADRPGRRAAADHAGQLTVHADRGSAMRSKPVAFLLADLGVPKTHNRPYTSTRQPLQRGALQDPEVPPRVPRPVPESSTTPARSAATFFDWYNHQHRHSGIGLMTPAAVHHGHAEALHAERQRVLTAAYARDTRAVRPPAAHTARATNRRLDQQARHRGGCTLNSTTKCLIRLDRLRAALS